MLPTSKRDKFLKKTIGKNKSLSVPLFLMASYLYYQLDVSLFSDLEFDKMCAFMLQEWSSIHHHHKALISEDDLRAGSGFGIPVYPERVKGAATRLAQEWRLLTPDG